MAGHTIHGGAIRAFADTVSTLGTMPKILRMDQSTTTLENKTNFVAGPSADSTITAECVPLHAGRQTQVWETHLVGGFALQGAFWPR